MKAHFLSIETVAVQATQLACKLNQQVLHVNEYNTLGKILERKLSNQNQFIFYKVPQIETLLITVQLCR